MRPVHSGWDVGLPTTEEELGRMPTQSVILYTEALDFANHLRALDYAPSASRLVAGHKQDCYGCPIAATATEGCLDGSWMVGPAGAVRLGPKGGIKRGYSPVKVPKGALEFMAAFDAGEFPELLAESTGCEQVVA